jgi:hypothetical protein
MPDSYGFDAGMSPYSALLSISEDYDISAEGTARACCFSAATAKDAPMEPRVEHSGAKLAVICCEIVGTWQLCPGLRVGPGDRDHPSSNWSHRAREAKVRRLSDDNK